MIDPDVELPDGWRVSTLSATARLVKAKVDPSQTPELPYVGLEHVEAHTMRLLGHGRGSDVKSTKTMFSAGDVLYGKLRPYLNKVAQVKFSGICSTDFLVFSESPELDTGYLGYYLHQLWVADQAHHLSNGVELPRVDWKSLSQLPVTYPQDKVLQRVIVAAIERARMSQTSAVAHLWAARLAIQRFRQAVLTAACSGRLTADWRTARVDEKDIEGLLAEIEQRGKSRSVAPAGGWQFDIPSSWALVSLDRLTAFITSGSRGWAKYYVEDGPLFIRSQDIKTDRLVLTDATHVRPPRGSEGERTKTQTGDLLVTITGANVTKAAWIDRDLEVNAYVNQHVALARPLLPELTEFLHLWITSPGHGRKKLTADAYGAGRPGLNLDNLREMPVGLPPRDEQAEIVDRVHKVFSLADEVDKRLLVAARQIERSSQAILAKAFRGELSGMERAQ